MMTEEEKQNPPTTVRELGIEFRGYLALDEERQKHSAENQVRMTNEISRLAAALETSNGLKADKQAFETHVVWGVTNVERIDAELKVLNEWKKESDNSFSTKIKKLLVDNAVKFIVLVITALFFFAVINFSKPETLQLIGK